MKGLFWCFCCCCLFVCLFFSYSKVGSLRREKEGKKQSSQEERRGTRKWVVKEELGRGVFIWALGALSLLVLDGTFSRWDSCMHSPLWGGIHAG